MACEKFDGNMPSGNVIQWSLEKHNQKLDVGKQLASYR